MQSRSVSQSGAFLFAALLIATAAQAQLDNSVWPTFRANDNKTGAAAVPGPAVTHAWTNSEVGIPSPAGFSVAANGDIYYKSMDDGGCYVWRIDPADGHVIAQSVNLGGIVGSYSGVAVGVNSIYTTIYTAAGDTSIKVLNKTTLAVTATITNAAFQGLRGTPLIGTVLNNAGHRNLYVTDRNAVMLHAVDSVTGTLMWSQPLAAFANFGGVGPMWVDGNGKQVIAHFGNAPFFGGDAIRDNGDNTATLLWNGGPDSFNWWGSGAMSADGNRIYVTTFNDNDVPPLWAINKNTGSVVWSVPGHRGDPNTEMNFFGRPSVIGDRVYCGGANGVVACYQDNGSSATLLWQYRDLMDEYTCISAVKAPDNKNYIYAMKQGNSFSPEHGELLVLRDDGNGYTLMLQTDLDGTMLRSNWSLSSCTVDGDGSLYIGGGNPADAGVGPAAIYKFSVGGGGYTLAVSGPCPGRLSIQWSGAAPQSQQAIIFASGTGSQRIPQSYPCAGTTLGLSATNLRLVDPPGFFSTGNGSGQINGQASQGACGGYLQMIQGGSCTTSNVVQISR